MEVITIEAGAFKEIVSMVSTTLNKVANVEGALKSLSDDRIMGIDGAMKYTDFGRSWLLQHKEEIGFIQVGNSAIKFRKSKLDAFLAKYEKQSKFKK